MRHIAVVLVAPCVFNADLQASKPDGDSHWGTVFSDLLNQPFIKVVPLPCPETEFCGSLRQKHGIDYYQKLEGFQAYCFHLAQKAAEEIAVLKQEGDQIIACLGVEHSPTCAASYLYSQHGTQKRAGIFFTFLFQCLESQGISFEKIGINRKHYQKAYLKLKNTIAAWQFNMPKAEDEGDES